MSGAAREATEAVKPVTLREVAAAAGVSVSTASKVLNGGGNVTPQTRARIQRAAERLDFRRNAVALSLTTGRSLTVGVLAQSARGLFSMPVLIGANAALGAADMASLMYDVEREPRNLREHIRKLQARRVDGLLVVGDGLLAPLESVTSGFDVPVVYVFGVSEDGQDTSFLPDSRMAGRLAGEHLIQIGRSRIAHVTASKDLAANDRAEGLLEVLKDAGLQLARGEVMRGNWTRAWGAAAATEILGSGADVDAIFCGNDFIALGVYEVFRRHGVRIPDDIALVGVDNFGGLFGRPDRLLSTIDPCHAHLGAAAVNHLLKAMFSGTTGGVHYQPCVLKVGESSVGHAAVPATSTSADADDDIELLTDLPLGEAPIP
jgi:LacI family transcriptional regulator